MRLTSASRGPLLERRRLEGIHLRGRQALDCPHCRHLHAKYRQSSVIVMTDGWLLRA